jgi:hypothetical protein
MPSLHFLFPLASDVLTTNEFNILSLLVLFGVNSRMYSLQALVRLGLEVFIIGFFFFGQIYFSVDPEVSCT